MQKDLQHDLLKKIGYSFKNPDLLKQALTHSSYVYENNLGAKASNERLEFLGDAVLELLTSELLYINYPNRSEGELSKMRANLVCEPGLAFHAREIGIGDALFLGRGEMASDGADKDSILSDALEAIIGAIYIDGGLEPARLFVENLIKNDNADVVRAISDPKSDLQEKIQKVSQVPIIYKIIEETGPAHLKKFTAAVYHDGRELGTGTGKSKKDAERMAASNALLDPLFI